MLVTEDLLQWLLADHNVCAGWKGLADRLQLSHLVPAISEDHHKCKLKLVLAAWKQERHDTYTVETLKRILSQEVWPDILTLQLYIHIRDLLTCTDGSAS